MTNRNPLASRAASLATRKGQAAAALAGIGLLAGGVAIAAFGGWMALATLGIGLGAGWAFGARHGARAALLGGAPARQVYQSPEPARSGAPEAFQDPQPASRESLERERQTAMTPLERSIASAERKIASLLAVASEPGVDSNVKRKSELVGDHAQKILEIARLSRDGITIAEKLEESFVESARQLVEKYARLRKLLTGGVEKQQATISALRGLDMVIDGLSQFRDSALKDDIRALESEVSMLEHNLKLEGLDTPKSHKALA